MEKLKEKLTHAGLTGNESKTYLQLLKSNELTANELSKIISTDRTLTYAILNRLIEKGLVSYKTKQNKKFFKAEKPENLLNPIKKKEILTKDLISELNKLGKYHCLDTTVTNSTRRYEQWGVSKSVLFWTKQWFTEKFGDLKKSEYEKVR